LKSLKENKSLNLRVDKIYSPISEIKLDLLKLTVISLITDLIIWSCPFYPSRLYRYRLDLAK